MRGTAVGLRGSGVCDLLDPIKRLSLDECLLGQAILTWFAVRFDHLVEFPAGVG